MKSNITKLSIITIISLFTLAVIGLSYAYFSTEITGEDKYVTLDTATLKLKYTDNTVLSLDNAIPGDFVTKTFTVENIGTKKVSYNIVWNNLINTINNYDLQLDMKCKSYKDYNTSSKVESGECSSFYKAVPYTETSINKDIKRNNEIDIGITHEYTVTITFKNRPYLQNDNLNKSFSGKIDLEEYVDPYDIIKSGESATYFLWLYLDETTPNDAQNTFFVGNIDVDGEFIPKNTIFCTTNTELTQGAEYVNGQYTYRYMQEGKASSSGLAWQNITSDGWGVQLTDKTSTDAVNSEVCTYINNKPIVSMSFMFYESEATTLDLSSFDTSNVTNMSYMFSGNTSNVTDMSFMFYGSQAPTLDVSNFNTSNVTDMSFMFYGSQAPTLDVSNFNTSNVTNMSSMFSDSQATTLDVSNFNISNVTDMSYMFSYAANLKTIYASNKFNTNNVTSSTDMFTGSTNLVGGAGTKYNSSHVDKTYARIDGGTSSPGYFTDVADKNIPEPSSFATDSWKTIIKAVKNNNISKYKIGDTKTIDMGTYGTHTLRIANTSTPSECSRTGFSQTACGFVLEFADIITEHKMNNTDTNVGGWPASKLRTYLNNDIYNAIPSEIKNAIIDTTVVSGHGSNNRYNSSIRIWS
ncbi:conserved domain protein [Clostridium sp. CAG:524]|nr:conserved domain protein [Clostridium sp. CAG:524]